VVAWGGSDHTNVPPNLTNVVAIAAGRYHSEAVMGDGTVVGWGAVVPPAPTNAVAISTSIIYQHLGLLALQADGTVVGSPPNSFGPGNRFAPLVAGLSNVVAIANGSDGGQGLVLK